MESTCTVYGIANCDAVKRTRAWLIARGVAHRFHDFRRNGIPLAELDGWLANAGWDALVNRRGTSWRKLSLAGETMPFDAPTTRAAFMAHPSLIKRPVVTWPDGETTIGFSADVFQRKVHSLNMAEPDIDWPSLRLPAETPTRSRRAA